MGVEQSGILSFREYFRTMTPMGTGLPVVGPSKRKLGALPTETDSTDGTFGPGTGGMSVSPDSPWHIPHHRRPRGMGRGSTGPAQDWVFCVTNGILYNAKLNARLDPVKPAQHAFLEPLTTITFQEYTAALETTQATWRKAWPQDLA